MSRIIAQGGVSLVCDDPIEVWRAETMFTKEPGTIKWLEDTVKPGDVFYDIGANIGIYTLLAAQKVGPTGYVYAFEPHKGNAEHLKRNAEASQLSNITVCPCAIHSSSGFVTFNYVSDRYGSSGSQLGHTRLENGQEFSPVMRIVATAYTLDSIVGVMRVPQVVKIDVDGNESQVLQGAEKWLRSDVGPRSIQVEIHPKDREAIRAFMDRHEYECDHVHYTSNGQKQIDAGADPSTIVNNTVFVKRAI